MKFCPNCGNELKSTNKFCPKCGKNLGNDKKQFLKGKISQVKLREWSQKFSQKAQLTTKKLGKKKLIGIGAVLVIIIAIIFGTLSSRTLPKVIPGHAYYVTSMNRYIAFGSGKYANYMIITDSKDVALNALESEERFARVYEVTNTNVSEEVGLGNEAYKVTSDQLVLTAQQSYIPNDDYFSNSNTAVVTDGWGALAASIFAPIIESGINDSLNSKNMQVADIRMDLTNVKISGWSKYKLTGTLTVNGKAKQTTFEEVKR